MGRPWTVEEDEALRRRAVVGWPDLRTLAAGCGRTYDAMMKRASRLGAIRLASARTRHSGRLGGRPRSRAGIAAARSCLAAVCATAATSAERSPGASVRAAGARSGKSGGAPGARCKGCGPTGRAGLKRLSDRSTRHAPRAGTN